MSQFVAGVAVGYFIAALLRWWAKEIREGRTMKAEWESRDWGETMPEDRRPQLSPSECSILDAIQQGRRVVVHEGALYKTADDTGYPEAVEFGRPPSPAQTSQSAVDEFCRRIEKATYDSDSAENIVNPDVAGPLNQRIAGRASKADQVEFLHLCGLR